MKWVRNLVFLGLIISLGHLAPSLSAEVRVWNGTITLPTYLLGDEDPNPPFPLAYPQNAYPYTMLDDLTDKKEPRTYRAIFLENEFLKATILPGMGGRLYSLYDKINRRDVVYRNNVVKYGLVAVRGAWISGGFEFNFPSNGHQLTNVSPILSASRQNPDGSATVILGDIDQITGMYWDLAYSLHPGEARLEQHVTLFNCTPITNLYQYWMNTAIAATDDLQYVFPTREITPHFPYTVWSYPVWKGIDYSWYKNIREPTSMFPDQCYRNFFGAYYHRSDYGVAHVADYRDVPGRKVWTWGVADDGLVWTKLLTDQDGPYNELQSGRYETQMYSDFMPPRRVESFTEYWYPVQGLGGGFVEATSQLALNVRYIAPSATEKERVEFLLSPTVEIQSAKFRVTLGSHLLREFGPISLMPLTPAKFVVNVIDPYAANTKLAAEVVSSDRQILLRWSAADPIDGNPDFVPAVGVHTPEPKSSGGMTVEELFMRGIEEERITQLEESAIETYRQALKRDPSYVPALLKLAWRAYRSADFREAESFVERALDRTSIDPTVYYTAGVIYRAAGKLSLAQNSFWAAIRYDGPAGPNFTQLGEVSIQQKRYEEAVSLLRQALRYNPEDALAAADLAASLRLSRKLDQAARVVDEALHRMPLLPFALAEKWRIAEARGDHESAKTAWRRWEASIPRDAQYYLEVAAWYHGLRDWASSDALLQMACKELADKSVSPLVYYYLASNALREDRDKLADEYFAKAASAPYEKVFPNRLSDSQVLMDAVSHNSKDLNAKYLLGNFLFARGRYDDAFRLWLKTQEEGFTASVLERNLGLYAWRVKKDLESAASFYEKAIKLAPNDFHLYADLDEIYCQMGDRTRRVRLFAVAPVAVLDRDLLRVRHARLLIEQKQNDQAVEALGNHNFKSWEATVIIHWEKTDAVREVFALANLKKGLEKLKEDKFREAEQAFRAALEYPANFNVGKSDTPNDERTLYWLGKTLKAQGREGEARETWQRAADLGKEKGGISRVFAGLSLRELGQTQEAERILTGLARAPANEQVGAADLYAAGVLDLLENRKAEANANFRRLLQIDPFFWPARLELEEVDSST